MMKKSLIFPIAIIALLMIGFNSLGQETSKFNYISPVPGSEYIMPGNNIALRHGEELQVENIKKIEFLISGNIRGEYNFKTIISNDGKTIILKPESPFELGEQIQVQIGEGVKTLSGKTLQAEDFSFSVASTILKLPENFFLKNETGLSGNNTTPNLTNNKFKSYKSTNSNLPDDFPEILINRSDNLPDNGYYFLAAFSSWGWFPDAIPYLIILDKFATPVFYRKAPGNIYDFKKLSNGKLSYYANYNSIYAWLILDEMYKQIDSYTIGNGYTYTDWHEFQLLPNGHAFVMAYDPQLVDMSQLVPGGNPEAVVTGWVVQELDPDRNVVFQWRSWDHYAITDAHEHVDLTAAVIDAIHGNAIEVVSESELLLSPRNLNEITKIDRNTGEIIWRLGGNNNMFDFIDDELGFSMQHDCRMMDNGNLSLFDNGTYHPDPKFSSTIEYELNETNFTATLIHRYRNTPDAFGTIMGNGQQLENGNIITGWGSSGFPALTEFNPEGEMLAEISFESLSYRSYRFPWETNSFSFSKDSLHYGYIWQEDSIALPITITNNTAAYLSLTGYSSLSDNFKVSSEFPVSLQPNGSWQLWVEFVPDSAGFFSDIITINSDINTEELVQRIAKQFKVKGFATEYQSIDEQNAINIQLYPNPVNDYLNLKLLDGIGEVDVSIYNSAFKEIYSINSGSNLNHKIDVSKFSNGLYFIRVIEKNNQKSNFYKFVKH
jgi:hypothetical protein